MTDWALQSRLRNKRWQILVCTECNKLRLTNIPNCLCKADCAVVPISRSPFNDDEQKPMREALCERYRSTSLSVKQIGHEFGVSNSCVTRTLAMAGMRGDRKRYQFLNDSDTELLVYLYKRGERSSELAERFGMNRTTVLNIAKRHGVTNEDRLERSPTSPKMLEAIRLYQTGGPYSLGMSASEVAAELNIAKRSVLYYLRKHGFPAHSPQHIAAIRRARKNGGELPGEYTRPREKTRDKTVPAEPLLKYLEYAERALPSQWDHATQQLKSTPRGYLYKELGGGTVTLYRVDKVLTALNDAHLFDIYPEPDYPELYIS